MHLPTPIQTYFTANPPQDVPTFAAAFAPDAIVHDEGHIHRGPQEICAWWQASMEKYRHSAEPLTLSEVAGKSVVRARVSGDFPGSPAILTFTFGLADNLITDMRINC